MPRKPRLDVPGMIYHVIGRGIEKKEIFYDDIDRHEFLKRLGHVVTDTATPIYAFALIPNHFHLLVRRGAKPVATVMRRLLTGYAIYFNKKHKRSGYLFQNRYKATICQEDAYLLQLIRYIHLNPVRAGLIGDLKGLKAYPFSGHSFLMGTRRSDWFDVDTTLSHFASTLRQAKNLYLGFLAEDVDQKADLSGGGLKRSLEPNLDRSGQRQVFDDRILGEGLFVEQLLAGEETRPYRDTGAPIPSIISSVCSSRVVSEAQLFGRSKERRIASARAELARRLSIEGGLDGCEIARMLKVSRSAVSKMLDKAERAADR